MQVTLDVTAVEGQHRPKTNNAPNGPAAAAIDALWWQMQT